VVFRVQDKTRGIIPCGRRPTNPQGACLLPGPGLPHPAHVGRWIPAREAGALRHRDEVGRGRHVAGRRPARHWLLGHARRRRRSDGYQRGRQDRSALHHRAGRALLAAHAGWPAGLLSAGSGDRAQLRHATGGHPWPWPAARYPRVHLCEPDLHLCGRLVMPLELPFLWGCRPPSRLGGRERRRQGGVVHRLLLRSGVRRETLVAPGHGAAPRRDDAGPACGLDPDLRP